MSPGRPHLARFAWLSIAAAIATIALKLAAWRLTGSVGLLSDAVESFVNLAAAIMALAMITVAARPPDEAHAFGYGKAEYFASGVEGALILLAAAAIAWTAVGRLMHPLPLESAGLGLGISVLASAVNLAVARVLIAVGRRHHSIALEADGHHLMTDVWTSVGVLAGIGLVFLTGWLVLDPLVALAVAVQIVWTGATLVRRSWRGLLDAALAPAELVALEAVLARHGSDAVRFHAVRTRQAGARRFVSMHVLVPGAWTVREGHDLLERIEDDVRRVIPNANVSTHLEAIEDPASFQDQELDRLHPGDR
ncbi:MAG TPA: cation diffusion facilitator family transporter [Anaeromyxobacter sp.]|nr:cation diffusion facilitator family transporter [Anaeromyxobacter sp.]